ncbi:CLUMA_CG010478, isoform A [Clunio marinus]|uniref:CLUMA_CG010478, isoform A n=1 Tax=Clunio marinus TaxID=568069 RepID=A0A1J1I9X6_9DIPT|nr:CLUMA_CG010478, isoform A [Clunio marinus]
MKLCRCNSDDSCLFLTKIKKDPQEPSEKDLTIDANTRSLHKTLRRDLQRIFHEKCGICEFTTKLITS